MLDCGLSWDAEFTVDYFTLKTNREICQVFFHLFAFQPPPFPPVHPGSNRYIPLLPQRFMVCWPSGDDFSENILISAFFLKNIFTGGEILDWWVFLLKKPSSFPLAPLLPSPLSLPCSSCLFALPRLQAAL